VHPG
jgi:hypothetical protein